MTKDNCADYDFITRPVEETATQTRLDSFMKIFTMIVSFIKKLFKSEIAFSNLFG